MTTTMNLTNKTYSQTSMKLNQNNYYSNDANWNYRSKSQYWRFLQCEAEALAELKGDYKPNQNLTPLLFGNYLHSYFESPEAHQKFIDEHKKNLYKYGNPTKGMKKDYLQADKCIQALDNDEAFKQLYIGKKEQIVKGVIDGINWMGKIDCLDLEHHRFFDLKTVDDIHKGHWNEELHRKVDFVIDRGYDVQMALYQELIQQTYGVKCVPYIIAVSKQYIPDKAIINFDERRLRDVLDDVRLRQDHIEQVINGEVAPRACGECEYCRLYKQLSHTQVETAGEMIVR